MKTKIAIIALSTFVITTLPSQSAAPKKAPNTVEKAFSILTTMEKHHYAPIKDNDTLSSRIFDVFLKTLDPYGIYFSTEQIETFSRHRFDIHNQIRGYRADFLGVVTTAYKKRMQNYLSLVKGSTLHKFDFSKKESFDFSDANVVTREKNMESRWWKWIKYQILYRFMMESDSAEAHTPPSSEKLKELMGNLTERLSCSYHTRLDSDNGVRSFTESMYLKSIAQAFDPHSQYLTTSEKNLYINLLSGESPSFGMNMAPSLTGGFEILDLQPGGPAWRSNLIDEGDVLMAIKNGEGRSISTECADAFEVQKTLADLKNGKATFTVQKKDGSIEDIELKNEVSDSEENTIRSYILKGKLKIGYIYFPSFYEGFSTNEGSSKGCANDLTKTLIRLKREKIQGLILDIRDNGGGSMWEAIRVAGLFIDKGAIAMYNGQVEKPVTLKDPSPGKIYDGPLAVLVNTFSASASELFAAAIQDQNRGIIVGSPTFGKSTVQIFIPYDAGKFDSLQHYQGDTLSYLKLTVGGFYRVTGATHQTTGVIPDISLPDVQSNSGEGEASYDYPLNLAKLSKKTYYFPSAALPIKQLAENSSIRVSKNPFFTKTKTHKPDKLSKELKKIPLRFNEFIEYFKKTSSAKSSDPAMDTSYKAKLPNYLEKSDLLYDWERSLNDQIITTIDSENYIKETYQILCDLNLLQK